MAVQQGGGREIQLADRYTRMFNRPGGAGETLTKIRDADTPEQAYQWAISNSNMGATKLMRLRRTMGTEEWDSFRATVLDRLGRSTPGQVAMSEVGGDAGFSVATFLKNYDALAPEPKAALFGNTAADRGGFQLRTALDRLMRVSSDLERARRTSNWSNTARTAAGIGLYNELTSGSMTRAGSAVLGGILAPNLTARLMTNARFVNWLAGARQAASGSPRAYGPWIGRLAQIATTEPSIQADIYKLSRQ